ncbi:hypothetical protein VKT23_003994 [Stygiomarasmius scandens]|uniref:Transmembrane protein n=1 Tax=Marasmiellus scandens TaxID=2682957 RepID=A0ABR1JTD4_9AGAR
MSLAEFESITFFIALGGFFLTCLLVNLFYKSSYYDETKRYRCWKFFIHFAASFLVNIVIATLLTVRFVREGLCIDFRKYAEDEDPPAVSESLRVGSIVILIFVWIFIPIMFAVAFIVLRNLQKISVDAMPMNSLELGQYRSAPHQTAHGEKWEDIPL